MSLVKNNMTPHTDKETIAEFEEKFWRHKKYDALTSSQFANISSFLLQALATQRQEIGVWLRNKIEEEILCENCLLKEGYLTATKKWWCDKCALHTDVSDLVDVLSLASQLEANQELQ